MRGDENAGTARAGDIVVIAVPYSSHEAIFDEIKDAVVGKIVVDAVVPLLPPKLALVQLPSQGSAGQIAQERIGGGARVVSAFHNVPPPNCRPEERSIATFSFSGTIAKRATA